MLPGTLKASLEAAHPSPAGPGWRVVSMDQVPVPPLGRRTGRYLSIFEELLKLPVNQALEVKVKGPRELSAARGQLARHARRSSRKVRVLSSRNAESTVLWVWAVPLGN